MKVVVGVGPNPISALTGRSDVHGSIHGGQANAFEDAVEVVVAVVFNLDAAFFGRVLDDDVGGKVLAEAVDDGADVDVELAGLGFRTCFVGRRVEEGLGEFFRSADGELAAQDLIGSEELVIAILDG